MTGYQNCYCLQSVLAISTWLSLKRLCMLRVDPVDVKQAAASRQAVSSDSDEDSPLAPQLAAADAPAQAGSVSSDSESQDGAPYTSSRSMQSPDRRPAAEVSRAGSSAASQVSSSDSDLPVMPRQPAANAQRQQGSAQAPVRTASLVSLADSEDSGPMPATHGVVQPAQTTTARLRSSQSVTDSINLFPQQTSRFAMEAEDDPASHEFMFEAAFVAEVDTVISAIKHKHQQLQFEATAAQMLSKLEDSWAKLQGASAENSDPFFLFKDGPVTQAAKLGQPLFLEDFDMPSQAATERLNSLLESEPTFAVTEDVTNADAQTTNISLPASFQVFASVHRDKAGQPINISAATKSRFTEIHITQYSDAELQQMIKDELQRRLPGLHLVDDIVRWIFELRELPAAQSTRAASDIRQLFRWVNFIEAQSKAPEGEEPLLSWEARVLLGARFLYFEEGHSAAQKDVVDAYPQMFAASCTPSWVSNLFGEPTEADLFPHTPFALAHQGRSLQLRYTHIASHLADPMAAGADVRKDLAEPRMFSAVTATLIKNMARIFASLSAKSPLLLEGPPGIGKTAVISQASCICRPCQCMYKIKMQF